MNWNRGLNFCITTGFSVKSLFRLLSAILLAVISVGCCSCRQNADKPVSLDGSHWKLETINGSSLIENYYASMYFRQTLIMGAEGVNTYYGHYASDAPHKINISECMFTALGSTERLNAEEDRFIATFTKIASYHIDGNKLILSDASGQSLLVFQKLPEYTENPTDLINTRWRPIMVNGEPYNQIWNALVTFKDDGTAVATTSRFVSEFTYRAAGDDIWGETTKRSGTTRDRLSTDKEADKFLGALNGVSNYRILNSQLEIYTMQQEQVAVVHVPVN